MIFDSSVLVGAGAGYTVTMTQATNDNGTIKYEEDYSKVSALWNTNDSWIYFKAENPYAPTQRLYTGDNAMECIIVRKLNKEQATAVYNDIPCIKNECE